MPLTAGKRDEENERFKNTLQRLVALTFVPENFGKINAELDILGLDLETLGQMDDAALVDHIKTHGFDFANAEHFADFLAAGFPSMAKAVYDYIQARSGVFSLGILNKIGALKS